MEESQEFGLNEESNEDATSYGPSLESVVTRGKHQPIMRHLMLRTKDPDIETIDGVVYDDGKVSLSDGRTFKSVNDLMASLRDTIPRYMPEFEDDDVPQD